MIHTEHLDNHTAEFDDQAGVLAIYGAGQRLALSANEAADLLIFLYQQRAHLLALLQQRDGDMTGKIAERIQG
jgi:hypothetical protein